MMTKGVLLERGGGEAGKERVWAENERGREGMREVERGRGREGER